MCVCHAPWRLDGRLSVWFNVVYYIYRISSVEKHMTRCYRIHARRRNCFEPPRTLVGRRTRTDRDGICPPPRDSPIDPSQIESPWRVSNLGPLDFESGALPTESYRIKVFRFLMVSNEGSDPPTGPLSRKFHDDCAHGEETHTAHSTDSATRITSDDWAERY